MGHRTFSDQAGSWVRRIASLLAQKREARAITG
jgi:hypothetical protein